jgi:hypothetical protein
MADPEKPPTSRMARVETALQGDDEFSVGDRRPPKVPVELGAEPPAPEPPKQAEGLLHRIRKRFFG